MVLVYEHFPTCFRQTMTVHVERFVADVEVVEMVGVVGFALGLLNNLGKSLRCYFVEDGWVFQGGTNDTIVHIPGNDVVNVVHVSLSNCIDN